MGWVNLLVRGPKGQWCWHILSFLACERKSRRLSVAPLMAKVQYMDCWYAHMSTHVAFVCVISKSAVLHGPFTLWDLISPTPAGQQTKASFLVRCTITERIELVHYFKNVSTFLVVYTLRWFKSVGNLTLWLYSESIGHPQGRKCHLGHALQVEVQLFSRLLM